MLALFLSLAWGVPSALFLLGVAQVNLADTRCNGARTLLKKKIKFSSSMRKFRMEQLQSHI
jgi:hypothetical protein